MESFKDNEFQLALVMSGGATRGAYSAGVLDYLYEVMMEWEAANARGEEDLPSWSVRIANMVSASAGGIASTMMLASLAARHEPLPRDHSPDDVRPKHNLLYRSWVSDFTVDRLFNVSDLPEKHPDASKKTEVRSLLNSTFIKALMNELVSEQEVIPKVPAWARDIELYFTIVNMRGIPFSFDFDVSLNKDDRQYDMLRHSDYMGFTSASDGRPNLFNINLCEERSSHMWQKVMDCAVASAAIPVVFPSVTLSRPLSQYNSRTADGTTLSPEKPSCDFSPKGIKPKWPEGMPETYTFNAVDGGVTNNEPLDIGRRALIRASQMQCLEKSANRSWGAILLVDTTYNSYNVVDPTADVQPYTMPTCLARTFTSLRREAIVQVKREELERALDENDFSQYIISPTRETRQEGQPILATGTLSDFGGMLNPKILHHDFMLGRRNCQQFLRHHFRIGVAEAKENPIFKNVQAYADGEGKDGIDDKSVCIIPILGKAAEECPMPTWPKFSRKERTVISKAVEKNAHARIQRILTIYAKNIGVLSAKAWWRFLANLWQKVVRDIINIASGRIYAWVKPAIEKALDEFE